MDRFSKNLLDATHVGLHTREDGLRVMILGTSGIGQIAQVQVDVRVGDDDEGGKAPDAGSDDRETAHFLEHLVAAMLRSRDYPHGEAKPWVEEHGIYSNAFTSAVRTSHYMSGHASKLSEMINIQVGAVADFLGYNDTDYLDLLVTSKRFEMEKQAVKRELSSKVNTPEYRMYEAMNAAVFKDHPRAVSQNFDMENVEKLTKEGVSKFFTEHYVAKNMMITIAGPVAVCQMPAILAMLEKFTFSADEPPARVLLKESFEKNSDKVQVERVLIPSSPTVRVTMAWPLRIAQYTDAAHNKTDLAAIGALTNFLTGGFTSRLLDRLRVKDGLVYSVSADSNLDERDPKYGTYQISTSVDKDGVQQLIHDTFGELRRIQDGPTPEEMSKFKLRIDTAIQRRILDRSPGSWVSDYANHALFASDKDFATNGGYETNVNRFARSANVKASDVKHVATKVIDFMDGHMIFLYGASEDVELTDNISKWIEESRKTI